MHTRTLQLVYTQKGSLHVSANHFAIFRDMKIQTLDKLKVQKEIKEASEPIRKCNYNHKNHQWLQLHLWIGSDNFILIFYTILCAQTVYSMFLNMATYLIETYMISLCI